MAFARQYFNSIFLFLAYKYKFSPNTNRYKDKLLLWSHLLSLVASFVAGRSLTHLVERNKLGVQAHQVSGLWHLADHERDEGGVALPLLPSQRGLCQQHAGIYGIFN